ncbi:hypothetical protein E2542_SST09313 [Spatholobus suberectus]|nr:hypothetical protein E2542_SST09313 [Spatholobus suberectus]
MNSIEPVYHRLLGADALCASGDCVIADYVLWCNECVSLYFYSLLTSSAPFLSLDSYECY